jgi:PAS domain S-box-containing protein
VKKGKSPAPPDTRTLHERAEAQLQAEGEDLLERGGWSSEETRELLHDLHTNQIELELQNEELERSQEELVEACDRYADLYDSAPVGYVTIGKRNAIIEANLTVATMLGVEKGSLKKQRLTTFIVDEDQDTFYLYRKQLLKTGKPKTCEVRMVKKDADLFWVQMDGVPVENGSAEHAQLRLAISDVTERKQAQDAARRSELLYQSVVDNLDQVVFVMTLDGVFTFLSPQAKTILGYDPDDLVLKGHKDLISAGSISAFQHNFALAAGGQAVAPFDTTFNHADGHEVAIELFLTDFTDETGTTDVLGVAKDITESKYARRGNNE